VPAEVAQPAGVEIDGMDCRHRVDQRLTCPKARRRAQRCLGPYSISHDVPVDEAHHVERRVVDSFVVAQPQRRRDRNGRILQSGDDSVLAPHVVSARQTVAKGRSAQHQFGAVGPDDSVRQIGVAAGDHLERERAASTGDIGLQPRCDWFNVDALHVVHAARTVSRYRADMAIDVTDATFQTEVVDRSSTAAVVVDLWAPWCGPCRTLGPVLEKVTDATNGEVILVKVNVDENPGVSQAFQVQSIPAVYALKNGEVVDGFVGAQPEHVVEEFVANLLPSEADRTVASLLAEGTEGGYRAVLELEPANEDAIVGLAEMLVARGEAEQALSFLARIPETDRTRRVAAAARVSTQPALVTDDYDARLADLLDTVKGDDEARQQFVDILELMGPDDPRTAGYRKQLTARLY
jgi:putative thioredoxin